MANHTHEQFTRIVDILNLTFKDKMTTLALYAHGRSQDRSDAQDEMLTAFFAPTAPVQ